MSDQQILADQEEPREIITVDGVRYDAETGEVLESPGGFAVDSQEKAEWVMERIFNTDCDIRALKARRTAYLQNIDGMISKAENRRKGLLFRFAAELEHFAKSALEGAKTKKWSSPFGWIQFRAKKAAIKVADPDKALGWAKKSAPEAVQVTEKFMASQVSDDLKALLMADDELREKAGYDLEPATETCSIKTGAES